MNTSTSIPHNWRYGGLPIVAELDRRWSLGGTQVFFLDEVEVDGGGGGGGGGGAETETEWTFLLLINPFLKKLWKTEGGGGGGGGGGDGSGLVE